MTRIVLVGNGPSLLKREIGSEIDSFDKVVRFNNFETEGFEKHVGKKCDILARRACDDVKLWPEEMFEQIVCFVTFCKWTRGMIHVANQLRGYYKNIDVVPPHVCATYGRRMELQQPNDEWASVGALALSYFTDKYDKVAICGFDHFFWPQFNISRQGYYSPANQIVMTPIIRIGMTNPNKFDRWL